MRTAHSILRASSGMAALAAAMGLTIAPDGSVEWAQAFAQASTGSIRGQVTDAESGVALQGARVTVVELDRRVVADETGSFEISDLPPGTYRLRVEFVGLPTREFQSTVTAGSAARADLVMETKTADAGSEIVVVGVNETTRRINQERAAVGLTEVATSSTSAEFPDRNVGEVLQRLTGTFVDRSGTGEGNILLLRSINPANNLVLIEGMRFPSGRPDGRVPNLASLNADVIDSMEVKKAFTPEIPGDWFGGYIDAHQFSAFSRSEPLLSVSLETGRRSITNNGWDKEVAVRGARRFFDDKFGIALAVAGESRDGSFEQITASRNPNGATSLLPTVFQYRRVNTELPRYSGNVNLEFRPNDTSRYFARGFWNYGADARKADEQLNLIFNPAAGSNPVTGGFTTVTPELATITLDIKERFSNYVAGGANQFGDWGVEYSAGYNRLQADLDNAARYGARGPATAVSGNYDFSDRESPQLTLVNPALVSTLSSFGTTVVPTTLLSTTEEDQVIGQLSAFRKLHFDRGGSLELRGGVRYDRRKRRVNAGGNQNYAPFPLANSLVQTGANDLYRGLFDVPIVLSSGALENVFDAPPFDRPPGDPNFRASVAGDFSGQEEISAAYLMGTYEQSNLLAVLGVRYEDTEVNGTNILINNALYNPADPNPLDDDPSDGISPNRVVGGYHRWLPAFVVRYEPTSNTLARFAVSKTYARPTLPQLLGGETVTATGVPGGFNRSIIRGNPALTPQDSVNFDASFDYYGERGQVFRIGAFYKRIKGVFYTASLTETNPQGGTDFISQPQNGGKGKIFGIEAGFVQPLSFLPRPLHKLSVEGNLAWTTSNQEVLDATGAVIRETDLENSYAFIGNASLVYRDRWGRARVAYRYSGKRLLQIDTNSSGGFNDVFRDASTGLDADISFRISSRVSLTLDARNLLNQIEVYEYMGAKDNLVRGQYSGRSFGVGLSFNY